MTDVVVISLEAWDQVWRRNQHLLSRLLARDPSMRVLFVEPSLDPAHAMSRRERPRQGRGLRRVVDLTGLGPGAVDRLWLLEPTKWLPRRVDRSWDQRWSRTICRAARRLDMRGPLLWVNDPSGARVMRGSGWTTVYDVTDDWMVADRPGHEIHRLLAYEGHLLAEAAAVVVCSKELMTRKVGARGTLHLIPNAVDPAPYRQLQERPPDLAPEKVALYAGSIHPDRIDLGLVQDVAARLHGGATVMLVGPHDLPDSDARRLVAAGVVLLGSRPAAALPAYLQHADVLLVPHVVTSFTSSLDPIKAYEYRAAGRPVVSTPVAGFCDTGDPSITVADRSSFPAAVLKALRTSPLPGPARNVSSVPTWDERAEQMAGVLAEVGEERHER